MAHTTPHAPARRRHYLSLAALLGGCAPLAAIAQGEAETQQVTIRAAKPAAGVTGFGQVPLASVPMQASVIATEQMRDLGVRRLSDIARIDAAVGDGYNAEGYYDFLSVRGFVLDPRFNYRRDGLPISAETTIALDNKSRIEVLKGTSGMLAGIGSPGGMVNFAVKRPTETPLREATLAWRQDGTVLAATDLSDRFGARREFGLRANAAYEHLAPQTYAADGSRYLLALAGDWRVAAATLLEAEIEVSHREQPSVPGFSVLGTVVPGPGNPRINLNNQPWSLPGVFDATTASLRWRQRLDEQWSFVAHAATQQLKTDDNTAFPYGCSAEGRYDRYCSDGTYDMYDFRSDNERRRSNVIDLSLHGSLHTAGLEHALTAGVQYHDVRNRFQDLAFNYAGTGNVQGTLIVPPAPALTGTNTDRDARSSEAYVRDAITFDERNTLWLGLRYTHQDVDTVRTDGSAPLAYSQSYAAPWLAFSHKLAGGTLLYASWGTGYEADLAPNNPRYINHGELLSALRSQQFELGAKGALEHGAWSLAAFDIQRPVSASNGPCDVANSCVWQRDGEVVHRGIDGSLSTRVGAWSLAAGAMALHARREGSATAALNGLRPPNVPAYTLRLQLAYRVDSVPGLELLATGAYDSERIVLPDNSLRIPGVGRFDLGLRYEQQLGRRLLTWRAGIENVSNERAWRESPYQFDHAYLFPLAPRTFALSVQAEL